jgi:amidohydrolase/hippurate hydrolase
MPNTGKDPMLFAAHAISALQTIVARNLHPLESGVVSVTQVHGGDTWNVIPQEVVLRGTARSFDATGPGPDRAQDPHHRRGHRGDVRDELRRFATSAAIPRRSMRNGDRARDRRGERRRRRRQRRCRSDAEHGERGFRVHAEREAGLLRLARRGRGPDTPNVHNPHYDFNDDALPIGTSYWVTLVGQQLGA